MYGPSAYRALYRPRCLPDGDVVVDSFHVLILPSKSVLVMQAGIMSKSDTARQVSNSAWHCGTVVIVDT